MAHPIAVPISRQGPQAHTHTGAAVSRINDRDIDRRHKVRRRRNTVKLAGLNSFNSQFTNLTAKN